MADLKDTTIRGDLSVEGSITPWGGLKKVLHILDTQKISLI